MKNATVSYRIEEDIKNDAEAILQRLGIPVSVAISSLYRQIIAWNGLPFSLTLPRQDETALDLSDSEFNERLERGYQQVMRHEGRPLDEVFDDLERKYAQ
ncbi:MAG: type II toxin-antitoxin system RelB/DinJ family antitoxin [Lachnospiraceae bacterium]|nr:type II toxin-antitoxin system RelB/DinJ family antitoxin [Lachnospiraceae bacterium]